MLRLRPPASATVSSGAFRGAALADAGAGVSLSAICAMKVPRATRTAAKMIMLRMTPHSVHTAADITTLAANRRLTTPVQAAISAKRMSEVLTGAVIHGLDPRIHLQEDEPSQGIDCRE